jgi:hypothetical protein
MAAVSRTKKYDN